MGIFFQANRVENGSRFKFEDKVLQLSYFLHIGKISSPISFTLLPSRYEYVWKVYHFQDGYLLFIRVDFYLIFENFVEWKSKMKFLTTVKNLWFRVIFACFNRIKPTSFRLFQQSWTRWLILEFFLYQYDN